MIKEAKLFMAVLEAAFWRGFRTGRADPRAIPEAPPTAEAVTFDAWVTVPHEEIRLQAGEDWLLRCRDVGERAGRGPRGAVALRGQPRLSFRHHARGVDLYFEGDYTRTP